MSKTVDQRVVEMRFDNKDFESNVKTSMSTLDKLKQSLKFDKAATGLNNLSSAAKQVNLSGLDSGIQTVNARFSALQVVGMTALSNITTAAMQAGKNLVSSFTIAPITDGFREYELQMNSVQTIMANTASKGTTIDQVTSALNELNEYADQTIYNFGEMTKNIGTFTAAGVDLDKATAAIKGIANLGAMSGSTSMQVSTAMYQLSQALAAGKVSLMDWNSVVNAGMGGEQFQNALKRTARAMGKDVDGMIEKYGTFRESLTKGQWLTADVLTETLNQISGAYTEADLIAKGYTQSQAAEIVQMAETATDAATKVKTFSQLMSTLSEAAGSGWAQTWQTLFGDFYEARDFFTELSTYFGDIIGGISEARNAVLGDAFDSNWTKLQQQVEEADVPFDKFTERLKEVSKEYGTTVNDMVAAGDSWDKIAASGAISGEMVVKTLKSMAGETNGVTQSTEDMNAKLEKFQKVVQDVWMGDYKNGQERVEALTAAGYDYAYVQDLVNKTVDGHKLTLEDLGEEQLKAVGYTEEEITAIKELAAAAEDANTPLYELINNLEKPSGRVLFLEGIQNVLKAIVEPIKAVGKAFAEVFAVDPDSIYKAVEGFNRFSKAILMNEDSLDKLTRTFKGIFGVIKIFTTLISGGFKLAFSVLTGILENFDLSILDVTATIGDVVYGFSEWISSGEFLSDILDGLKTVLGFLITPISNFFGSFSNIGPIDTAAVAITGFFSGIKDYISELLKMNPVDALKKVFTDVKNVFVNLKNSIKAITWDDVLKVLSDFGEKVRETFEKLKEKMKEIGPDIIEGLQNGIKEGIEKIFEFMRNVAEKIIEAVKAILGIHSPSTVFFEIGKNIIDGLCNGIEYTSGRVADTLRAIIGDIKSVMEEVDWKAVIPIAGGIGAFIVLYQLTDAMQTFATGFKSFGAPFQKTGDLIGSVQKTVDAFRQNVFTENTSSKGFENLARGIKTIAEAIAILAAAVGGLSLIEPEKLWTSVGAVAALALVVGALSIALSKFSDIGSFKDSVNLASILLSMAGTFVLLGIAAKIISEIDVDGLKKAGVALGAFAIVVAGLIAVTHFSKDLTGAGAMLGGLAGAFLLLAIAARIMGGLSPEGLQTAVDFLGIFGIVMALLIGVTQYAGDNVEDAGKFAQKVGVAFLLLAASAKILGTMNGDEMQAAVNMISMFGIVVGLLVALTSLAGPNADKAAVFVSKIGIAFLALGVAARIIGGMEWGDMGKAAVGLIGLTVIVGLLVAITKLAPEKEMAKISATLLSMALVIGILGGIAILLSYVEPEALIKGIAAVGALAILVSLMTKATKGASDVQGTMIGIAVAIGVMAGAVALLSFIEPGPLVKAVAALSALMLVFSIVAKAASDIKTSLATMIVLVAAIAAITGAIYLLSGIPAEQALSSSASLSIVMIALAAACKIIGEAKEPAVKALASMILLLAVMAGVAGVLILMSAMNVQNAIPNAVALSALLLAMSAACLILGQIKQVDTSALVAMGVLTAVVAGLAVILGVMSALNVQASIPSAIALGVLLNAMAAACLILSMVKVISPAALVAIGVMTIVVGLLAVVLGLMSGLNVQGAMPNALALSTLLLAMSAALVILTVVGLAGPAAAIGIASLMGLIIGIGGLLIAIGALVTYVPQAEEFLNKGIPIMEKIGSAIGGFVGNLIGSFAAGIADSLPDIGEKLSAFMESIQPFINGASGIDPAAMEGVKTLAEALLTLTAGDLLNQVASFFGGESSMEDFANQLVPFGEALAKFSKHVEGIDPGSMMAAAIAGQALADLANNLPKEGGLAQAIFGDSPDMGEFGNQMAQFGLALRQYGTAVDGINIEAIMASAQAGQALSDLANTLPKSGGLAQAILGESPNMGEFGNQMYQFGIALRRYATAVDGINIEAITASAQAGQALANLAASLPTDGGLAQAIFGENTDMGEFGKQIVSFGNALQGYAGAVAGLDIASILMSVQAGQLLNMLAQSLPKSDGGLVGAIFGSDSPDMVGFGEQLVAFGNALKNYAGSVSGIDFGAVQSATMAAQRVVNFLKANVGLEIDDAIKNLSKLKDAGDAIKNYYNKIAGIDAGQITASVQSIGNLITYINRMGSVDVEGIQTFKAALDELATISLDGVIAAFNNAASQLVGVGVNLITSLAQGISGASDIAFGAAVRVASQVLKAIIDNADAMSDAGDFLAGQFASGISEGEGKAESAGSSLAGAADRGARNGSLFGAGLSLAGGFADGIAAGAWRAKTEARAMANAAAQAVNEALDINSPSKVFRKIGTSVPEGFAMGIGMLGRAVTGATRDMADTAVDGAKSAMLQITSELDSDMDVNPTIRPVLDLSDVQNGARSINGMFSGAVPLNVVGNANRINRMMNTRNQNGVMDDLANSVHKLNKMISNGDLGGDTINVNGIQYAEGTNVAEAVKDLTRAIRMERRV